jgi:hypothetical protein
MARLHDNLIGLADDQQRSMRLNGTRQMDLLTLAVRKVRGSECG